MITKLVEKFSLSRLKYEMRTRWLKFRKKYLRLCPILLIILFIWNIGLTYALYSYIVEAEYASVFGVIYKVTNEAQIVKWKLLVHDTRTYWFHVTVKNVATVELTFEVEVLLGETSLGTQTVTLAPNASKVLRYDTGLSELPTQSYCFTIEVRKV